MKTAEDWARKIEADPSTRVISKGRGGVLAASELWALAQTLGRKMRAVLHIDLGVNIYINPNGYFTVYLHNRPYLLQYERGRLVSQTVEQYREGP